MKRLKLFAAFGVELEYMIVDRSTLDIKSIADELLKHELGSYGSDFEHGLITWSNELVLHVIELKSTSPNSNFNSLSSAFSDDVRLINGHLSKWDAMLLPTAAHPWMNPNQETKLWPHDNNAVYSLYNEIFDCRGHGWSNLQSTHLNLPFLGDQEFEKLHAAIRLVLPLLPALCASSPILDGKFTGYMDSRMTYYKGNQSRIPSITGRVVPPTVLSRRHYADSIYKKIKRDLAPFDKANVLDPVWVNSRGAIPRFDRGSIEIRIMDVQECPPADLAIQSLVIETLRALVSEEFISIEEQHRRKTEVLAGALDETSQHAMKAVFYSSEVPEAFGLKAPCTAQELWSHIYQKLRSSGHSMIEEWEHELEVLFRQGSLAERIMQRLRGDSSPDAVRETYRRLSDCLAQNKMFIN